MSSTLRNIIILVFLLVPAACVTPVPEMWESIPILPGAEKIEQTETSYTYRVNSPLNEVEGFYTEALNEDTWSYQGLGEGLGGIFLVFTSENAHLEISAYQEADVDEVRIVILLQSRE